MASKRIAVVGSGCSAMGALWALRESGCVVHLYEAGDRMGGHTNTVPFRRGDSVTMVDAGFIAHNRETYPNFVRFLDSLGIESVQSEMSLAFSRDSGNFEWAGTSVSGLFAQITNLFRLSFWRMLFDIIRFNFFCLDALIRGGPTTPTAPLTKHGSRSHQDLDRSADWYEPIGTYLRRRRYSDTFINNYLIPMLAATWCTRPDIFQLECPAGDVIRFMWNHHLLESLNNPLKWYTIRGGARTYIDRFMALHDPTAATYLNSPVSRLERLPDGTISLHTTTGSAQTYDHVILTVPAAECLRILSTSASDAERAALGSFTTCTNTVILHSDPSLMPRRVSAWSGWNYLCTSSSSPTFPATSIKPEKPLSTPTVTFDMNTLQHIPRSLFGAVLCTMNPPRSPDVSTIQGRWVYEHPVYSAAAVRASASLLPAIQDAGGVGFAGAWTGQGFHEDGFTSGIRAAIGFLRKFGLEEGPERGFVEKHERRLPDAPGFGEGVVRGVVACVQRGIELWEGKG